MNRSGSLDERPQPRLRVDNAPAPLSHKWTVNGVSSDEFNRYNHERRGPVARHLGARPREDHGDVPTKAMWVLPSRVLRRHSAGDAQISPDAPVHELRSREDKTLAVFARWCFLHRRVVLAAWVIALIGFLAVGRLAGSAYTDSASLPRTDSSLTGPAAPPSNFPTQSGDVD